ncbi:MAG: isocitrate lyase/phosphoenolpyruvate mutase family protein [Chloroflexi bacterium]|nr:isocitrate lyase/phosphoenolpyruvate mutase family protein [Chloroflexota bacterium]
MGSISSEVLRKRLSEPRILVVPGAADALTASIIQSCGFEAVYFTGGGFANSSLGVADVGLTTMSETVAQVQRIADAVNIPLIVDADTGYGGPLNVIRTVREIERAGAAAIQLEDQITPKRCGHFEGKTVISTQEMVKKVQAAVDTRRDPLLVIIARTDARASEGLEGALDRGRAYAAAGADMIFVEALESLEELRSTPQLLPVPVMVNMVEGGKTPLLDAKELEAMGYRLVLFANTALRVAVKAVQDSMRVLRLEGTSRSLLDRMINWEERQRLVRLPELQTLDERYSSRNP